MTIRRKAAVSYLILGFTMGFAALWGITHYEGLAIRKADEYILANVQDFQRGDYVRAHERYLGESRVQRVALHILAFGGYILAAGSLPNLWREK